MGKPRISRESRGFDLELYSRIARGLGVLIRSDTFLVI